MTATSTPTPTPSAPPLHRRLASKAYIGPSIILAIAVLLLGGKVLDSIKSDAPTPQQTYDAQREATADVLREVIPPTTTGTAPAPPPGYDYLTCTASQPTDPTLCVPVLAWPLTEGAKNAIGFASGGRATGQLSTVNTRIVLDQLRRMVGVDECSMWLGLKFDEDMNPKLTLYASQVEAPRGASALVDCAPRAGVTQGTVPTESVA